MAISGTIKASWIMNDTRTVGINTAAVIPTNWNPSATFTDGAGALQANVLYQGSLALTAGAYNFDLAGVLTDSFGSTVTLARVKAIGFINNGTAAMTLGAHATAAWSTWLGTTTSTKIVRPGGWFIDTCVDATGWAVTATTADILKIAGTGTDGFYIFIAGSST